MRIAFFGLPLAALLLAADGHEIVLAVLSPIVAPGRRRLERTLGAAHCIDARDGVAYALVEQRLREAKPDLIVSWFWTRRIPAPWLDLARLGGIGAHPSLLPRHRGPNPYFWAIDCGDRETGVTVHRLESEYDTGHVLGRVRLPIGSKNAWQLARALDRPSLSLLRRIVQALACGEKLTEELQSSAAVTEAPEPSDAEMRVDWAWPTERILRRIRALSPVPGLAIEIEGVNVFVLAARSVDAAIAALLPGEAALRRGPPLTVVICTGDGTVAVDRVVVGEGNGAELSEGREYTGRDLAEALMRRSPEMVSSVLD